MTANQAKDCVDAGFLALIIILSILYGMISGAVLAHLYLKRRCRKTLTPDRSPEPAKSQPPPKSRFHERKPKNLSIITSGDVPPKLVGTNKITVSRLEERSS